MANAHEVLQLIDLYLTGCKRRRPYKPELQSAIDVLSELREKARAIVHESVLGPEPRRYGGPIEPGMRFVWEPGQPHAFAVIEVTKVRPVPSDETRIWTRTVRGGAIHRQGAETWNEESRFREAVVPESEYSGNITTMSANLVVAGEHMASTQIDGLLSALEGLVLTPGGGIWQWNRAAAAALIQAYADGGSAEPGADEQRPVFWQHAISECNEAHAALDRHGVPKTKIVPRLRGEGEQEITIGLAERIHALVSKR